MSLTTYALTGNVYDAAGSAIEGAVVRLRLVDTEGSPTDDYVSGGGAAMPQELTDTTDANGAFSISAFSNLDGVKDTRYLWTVEEPNTGAELGREIIQMPRAASTIDALADSTAVTPTPQTAAAIQVAYAAEWANKAEDSLVSSDAGGDQVDDYSARHQAAKAQGSATAASTSESNAATSETNAASSASAASTSESNAATSESNAASSASAASTSESNAATSETNAASSASAASTSETNAATSETNAANSASAAATSETNAGNSATAAGVSETNAADSEAAAATSESNAATSETNAAGSASAASTSETNAAASETDAEAARDAAQTAEANAFAIADSDMASARLDYGITNVGNLSVCDTSKDDDPDWIYKATWQSWYGEDRPTGSWLGSQASGAALIAAGAAGDYSFIEGNQTARVIDAGGTTTSEIFRGSKAQAPRTSILVSMSGDALDKLLMFDADDLTMPLWMAFDADQSPDDAMSDAGIRSAVMKNGFLVCALETDRGIVLVDFVLDEIYRYDRDGFYKYAGNIAARNDAAGWVTLSTDAAYTLSGPGASKDFSLLLGALSPIDPRRGMRRPIVGLGTTSGTWVVIFEDGTVDSPAGGSSALATAFLPDGSMIVSVGPGAQYYPEASWRAGTTAGIKSFYYSGNRYSPTFYNGMVVRGDRVIGEMRADGEPDAGLANARFSFDGLHETSWQRTEWAFPSVVRDKLALALSSTETADLVAATPLDEDFSSSLGVFTDTSDGDASVTVSGGKMVFDCGTGSNPIARASFATVVGATYRLFIDVDASDNNHNLDLGTTAGGADILNTGLGSSDSDKVFEFVAETTTTHIELIFGVAAAGELGYISEVNIDRIEPDRSGNDAGPIAYGTLTRSAVATGNPITSLSGWGTNYLAHAFDHFSPGTNDFSITRVVSGGLGSDFVVSYGDPSGTNPGGVSVQTNGAQAIQFNINDGATSQNIQGSRQITAGEWVVFTVIRRGSVLEAWVDGRLEASATVTATGSLTITDAVMYHGRPAITTSFGWGGEISSIMLDANYAPTADQIREQHAILRAWHSEDADPTLLSDTVDALAYDDERDLLYVAGPSGTTVLHGSTLTRDTTYTSSDANLTSDDHNAVAGGGGISVVASANEVRFSLPALALRDKLLSARRVARDGIGVQRAATTDATPTVVAAVHVPEGAIRTYRYRVRAYEAGDPSSGMEAAGYSGWVTLARGIDGNVFIMGGSHTPTTDYEVTSSQDLTFAVDTTNQLGEWTGTGVASTDMVWESEITLASEMPMGKAA